MQLNTYKVILIIYIFTVIWSLLTFVYGKYLINKQLKNVKITGINSYYDILVKWKALYFVYSIIPVYNIGKSFLFLYGVDRTVEILIEQLKLFAEKAERYKQNSTSINNENKKVDDK
jgi:hypothetical protein